MRSKNKGELEKGLASWERESIKRHVLPPMLLIATGAAGESWLRQLLGQL